MQIHEITEGFLRNVASGFVQGLTGADFQRQQVVPTGQIPGYVERTIVSIEQPDSTRPANYYKLNNVWTNELGQQVKGMKQVAYLNSLIPTHGRKEKIDLSKIASPQARKAKPRRSVK